MERAVRALDAFANQRYEQAYDLAVADGTDFAQRNGVFLAGLAALRSQRWNDAVKMFEAWSAFGLKNGLSPMHAAGKIMLARALAGSGRVGDARTAYEEAFRIWKDADPDLPVLLEARREYQQLSS